MQKFIQKQLTAHDKILIFNNLRYLLEGLEEYIEKAGFYPDFDNKRQLRNITIPKEQTKNASVDDAEDFFLTNLILYVSMVNQAPEYFRKGELMDEYYKWIDATGISARNCPEKLKQFLIEIKNVLEGNSKRIVKQTEEYLANKDKGNLYPSNPQDVLTLFGLIQKPLRENRKKEEFYKEKNDKDVEIQNRFNADINRGKEGFNQISQLNSNRDDFDFYWGRRPFFCSGNPQLLSNSQIIQDVKNNSNNWRIDEIIIEYDSHGNTKKESSLIHRLARVDDYEGGGLRLDRQPIYRAERFNHLEINKIEKALNISQNCEARQEHWGVRDLNLR